ncbi:hypothetical protein PoB_001882600 [Plakobranchus ocellatus]|uniref:KIAA0895 n=1 Tax=Plakobranchus ocellatus TaxID=259542 RepID=A0AAV3ZCF6_9GAST|nr:hypothetical protein PoB_001882600 [Plakobranchus ocellatus]
MFYRRYRQSVNLMGRPDSISYAVSSSVTNSAQSVTVFNMQQYQSGKICAVPGIPLTDRPRKKRKKRIMVKQRKSLNESNLTSHCVLPCQRSVSSLSDSFISTKPEGAKTKRLPRIMSPSRLDELAAPSNRQNMLSMSLVIKNNERKKKLPLLVAIKPENERSEKERFMRASFNYNPYFVYKGEADNAIMDKFRDPSNKYLTQAILIMEKAIGHFGSYENFEEITGGKILNRSQIYLLVKRYISREELEDEVVINLSEDLLSRGSMSRAKGKAVLSVRSVNLREHWAEGLLRHELGTHYLRSCNNRYQPWYSCRVRRELAMEPMNPTEEGLASLHSVLFREKPFLWRAALLYYTTYMASKLSFKELFSDLEKFVYSPNVRWDYCLRAKRGQVDTSRPGSFCKDQVYLEGLLQLLKRRRILDFPLLVRLGKVSFEDVNRESVTELANLTNTRIPWFMEDLTVYHRQLDHIAHTNGLTDNILSTVD